MLNFDFINYREMTGNVRCHLYGTIDICWVIYAFIEKILDGTLYGDMKWVEYEW